MSSFVETTPHVISRMAEQLKDTISGSQNPSASAKQSAPKAEDFPASTKQSAPKPKEVTKKDSTNNSQSQPLVGIIMGSKSDLPAMQACMDQLDEFGVPYELVIASAHRNPQKVHEWASTAKNRGLKVIIAAAGKAAHLGGVVAAYTPLPIVGVPMKTSDLGGMDSLLSMVQMPSGVPVACVAIGGSKNAAIYATQILGSSDARYAQVIATFKQQMAEA